MIQQKLLQQLCTRLAEFCHQDIALDRALLSSALRHRSDSRGENYERLEFLGDRLLALHVAEMLMTLYPDSDEGGLARRHAELVSGKTLNEIGQFLHIDDAISLVGNPVSASIRADVVEAILGYLYITGQTAAVRALIETLWRPRALKMTSPPDNARGILQEWALGRGLPAPEYRETERTGSEHAPLFCFSVQVESLGSATGWGKSKQAAKTAAAKQLVKDLPL